MLFECDVCGKVRYKADMCPDSSTIRADIVSAYWGAENNDRNLVIIICKKCSYSGKAKEFLQRLYNKELQ